MSTQIDVNDTSIYYEALWVIALFAATATLREAFGELCVHAISKSILSRKHITGKTLDVFTSCSNGGRSLGFGAGWRMWNLDPGVVRNRIVIMPLLCWVIGMPIKLVAVEAVRGGNSVLGYWGTWALGICWIALCFSFKGFAIFVDRKHGLVDNGKLVSYRKVFQMRFCTLESYGMMLYPQDYNEADSSYLKPTLKKPEMGIDIKWDVVDKHIQALHMSFSRGKGESDPTLNGLDGVKQEWELETAPVDDTEKK